MSASLMPIFAIAGCAVGGGGLAYLAYSDACYRRPYKAAAKMVGLVAISAVTGAYLMAQTSGPAPLIIDIEDKPLIQKVPVQPPRTTDRVLAPPPEEGRLIRIPTAPQEGLVRPQAIRPEML